MGSLKILSGVGEVTKTKKQLETILNVLSNHVLSKLTSIDNRLDRQESLSDKILEEVQGLRLSHDTICQRLLLLGSLEEGE